MKHVQHRPCAACGKTCRFTHATEICGTCVTEFISAIREFLGLEPLVEHTKKTFYSYGTTGSLEFMGPGNTMKSKVGSHT